MSLHPRAKSNYDNGEVRWYSHKNNTDWFGLDLEFHPTKVGIRRWAQGHFNIINMLEQWQYNRIG